MRKLKKERPFIVDHGSWIIELRKASGEGGYYCFMGEEGPIISKEEVGAVQRFKSLQDAEAFVKELVRIYGLDIEEATPQLIVCKETESLWLDDREWPDGLSVEQLEDGTRYLLIRDDGVESTVDDLEEDVADAIVRVLEKIKRKLAPKKA